LWLVAVDTGAPSGTLTYAIWTFLGIVVTTIGLIIQQYLKVRTERTALALPSPDEGGTVIRLVEQGGRFGQRIDDHDELLDLIDKQVQNQRLTLDEHHARLRRVEDFLRRHHHDWTDQ
jgi:hypothetical protein